MHTAPEKVIFFFIDSMCFDNCFFYTVCNRVFCEQFAAQNEKHCAQFEKALSK